VIWLVVAGGLGVVAQQPELRYGGDAEGGAPFMEADPRNPSQVVGFEVDIAELLARALGRAPRFVQSAFITLDATAARGDFDIGLGGVEDTAVRRSRLAVTVPYYEFRELLTVREADGPRFRTLADLAGRRVGTLGSTLAFDILQQAGKALGLVVVPYENDVHPYSDLALGRLDAVVLDAVLAERGVKRNPGLVNAATSVGVGRYVGILAPEATALREQVDAVLKQAMRDGRLEAIFRKWRLWNDDQPGLYARVLAGSAIPPDTTAQIPAQAAEPESVWRRRGSTCRRFSARPSPRCCSPAYRWRSPSASAFCSPPDACMARGRWAWR